jgi:multisubunit Na+/H+ antiporter MnhC subunit
MMLEHVLVVSAYLFSIGIYGLITSRNMVRALMCLELILNAVNINFAPTVLQLGSFHRLSRVEPWDLTADLKSHLQTLYAQSFRITLASSVLPRLLAQS